MNEIRTYESNQFGSLRVVNGEDGEPWFVAKDVCEALGLNNVGQATNGLDADEKGSITINDGTPGNPNKATISEAGLYSLILRSRKPEAKAFKRWVTHEVLPSIRRDGGYIAATEEDTDESILARAVLVAERTIRRLKDRAKELEQQNAEQAERIEEMKPKALFADAVSASDGTCLVGEVAKMLRQTGVDVGQNRLFEWLRRDGVLGKSGSNKNVPTQYAMDNGWFKIKETTVVHSDGHVTLSRTPKVTGKGQRYLIDRYGGEMR